MKTLTIVIATILSFSVCAKNYEQERIFADWTCYNDGANSAVFSKTQYNNSSFHEVIYTIVLKDDSGEVLEFKTEISGTWTLEKDEIIHIVDSKNLQAINEQARIYLPTLKNDIESTEPYSSFLHELSDDFMSFWSSRNGILYCIRDRDY
ncbi:hypothetical protein [Vibrio sp. SCSIO 43137]|uniref:hypothetical protein n=1 Tax=Vibrio sp. SCSIO 43137 TaxID=3021011 RepID=UPI00230718D5|nr:hypothetical protein [Vibrio sp. SCSIO 43137]WCE30499.1 hypothetical protein PK654_04265 [Vibrio sp. SCSIO 43137]